jgi:hypothetical protein
LEKRIIFLGEPMSYAATGTDFTVVAVSYSITMDPLPHFTYAGYPQKFTGKLLAGTTGVGGETVKVQYCLPESPSTCYDVGSSTTASDGSWSITWNVPFEMAGKKYWFRAVHVATGATSDFQAMTIAYFTRISVSAPSTVAVNVPFTVTGKLEYQASATTWLPLAGRTIVILDVLNALQTIASGTTLSDGSFAISITLKSPGTYKLRAYYAGEGLSYGGGETGFYAPAATDFTVNATEGGEQAVIGAKGVLAGLLALIGGALVVARLKRKK